MYRILIVEDEPLIADAIAEKAAQWGMEPHIAENLRDITGEFHRFRPHLVVLDIILPFFNGYHWCNEIRKESTVPILFISSAADNMNIVMAMDMGADDFIAKPFAQNVLIAKIRALLRRTYDFAEENPILEYRNAFLNTGEHSLTYGGQTLQLTKNEYRILFCLMENKGKIVSRERLMERLWETDLFVDENTLTVNVNRLRKKLEQIGLVDFITTRFGEGYLLEEKPL